MCEAPNNSRPLLWGEIEQKACSDTGKSFWSPMHEYQNVIQPKINSHQCDCPEKEKQLCYDPVGQHLILLRDCHSKLNALLPETEVEENKCKRNVKCQSRSKPKYKRQKLPPYCTIPEFPVNSSFSDSLQVFSKNNPKLKITCRRCFHESHAKEQITHCVKQVLAQSGYYVKDLQSDTPPIKFLSNITHNFLTGLISRLRYHKNSEVFSENDDLWGPLETTLQEIEFGGIRGLHHFYCEKVVKKRDVLFQQCKDLLNKHEKL